jgi:hypothetical protein
MGHHVRGIQASSYMSFSTVIYWEDVAKDDYFEIYVNSSGNNDLVTLSDINGTLKANKKNRKKYESLHPDSVVGIQTCLIPGIVTGQGMVIATVVTYSSNGYVSVSRNLSTTVHTPIRAAP